MTKARASHPTSTSFDEVLRNLVGAELVPLAERLARIEAQQAAILAALQGHGATSSYEQWLDVRTACDRTGLGTTKVHSLIASGALASTKVGARRLIAASSIDALMRPATGSRA